MTIYYPIIKQIAKWLGVSLTKNSFAKGVSKVIPFIGGAISGGLSLATFLPAAKRLHKKLNDQMDDIKTEAEIAKEDENVVYAEYEEVTGTPKT